MTTEILPTAPFKSTREDGDATDAVSNPDRLAALYRTGLLDTASPAFDRLTRLAARILDVPVALVSLVDKDRQFFTSCVGLPEPWATKRETPLSHSFCQHVVRSGEPLLIEDARLHPLVRDNGAVTELNVVAYAGIPLRTADGNVLGSFCAIDSHPRSWTGEDVSLLRDLAASAVTEIELHLALQETQERAADAERERNAKTALLESTVEGVYGIDNQGLCTFFNRAAAGMTRFEPEEVLGRNMHDLLHHTHSNGEPYPEEECPIYRGLRQGEGSFSEDEMLWRSDGTSFPAELTSSPIIEGEVVRGAVVTISNITRRKQLEKLRDDLTDMVVHDLRTPLTSILSGLQTLEMTSLDAEQQELLDIGIAGGKTLLGMVNDLLDVSKSENSGTLTLERTPLSAQDLVQEALKQVVLLARQKEISLISDAAPTLEPFVGDREKLVRTLVNLLGNALKFTPAGGQVTLRAYANPTTDEIAFSVTDTGEGIPTEAFERIFEKFGQVENRRLGRKMSTGLGLTFCKMAVEAHGGRIWVESEPEVGSRFSFTLPSVSPIVSGCSFCHIGYTELYCFA
jgi:PAS domain S-box-containing protein